MSNYLIILIGWIIGQLSFTFISAYFLQRNLSGINFIQAVKVFIKKEMGGYFVSLAV